ncbi:hypothetical protein KY389_11395 [Paracoccus bogoriensis]|uniref:hypothetical protein n=1 Tax=Paracoccus bogoriensis TaxID=242065 RepID=UPI001CA501BE|nr:hypothetical protein [Paracoccus bogoriensis]MBW7057289.1 hypothetical protein [Paracoccus bogoriensis]
MTGHHPFSGKPLPRARPFSRPLSEAEAETVIRNIDQGWDAATLAEARDVQIAAQRRAMDHLRHDWIAEASNQPHAPVGDCRSEGPARMTAAKALFVILLCLIAGGLGLLGAHMVALLLWGPT